jgi:hypothetical protein
MDWLKWLKGFYETFGLPHPTISLVLISLLGALLFGSGWTVIGRQVEKDRIGHGVKREQKTGDATTTGDQSPAVSGNSNNITYEGSPSGEKKHKARK